MVKKMKRFLLLVFLLSLSLFGCSLSNTPTSKVEELLMKYQKLDSDIKADIETVLSDDTLTLEQKNRYRALLEKQYKNMQYEVKEEMIDGDKAVVTVSIEVTDFKKVIKEVEGEYVDMDNYSIKEYNDTKLQRLEKTMDKVTYTLDIDVIKDENGNWYVDNLTNLDKKKIQGMY
mgnify:CR=1 FL=1